MEFTSDFVVQQRRDFKVFDSEKQSLLTMLFKTQLLQKFGGF